MSLSRESGCSGRQERDLIKIYLSDGETGLDPKKKLGNPRDNAVMESFWGRFKDTLRKHFRYWECEDLKSTIE